MNYAFAVDSAAQNMGTCSNELNKLEHIGRAGMFNKNGDMVHSHNKWHELGNMACVLFPAIYSNFLQYS